MSVEEKLYKIIFPEDDITNYINYGYFIGRNKKLLYKLKALVKESELHSVVVINDEEKENAFFAKVMQCDVDDFLYIVNLLEFKQIKIPSRYMEEIKYMFGDYEKY